MQNVQTHVDSLWKRDEKCLAVEHSRQSRNVMLLVGLCFRHWTEHMFMLHDSALIFITQNNIIRSNSDKPHTQHNINGIELIRSYLESFSGIKNINTLNGIIHNKTKQRQWRKSFSFRSILAYTDIVSEYIIEYKNIHIMTVWSLTMNIYLFMLSLMLCVMPQNNPVLDQKTKKS